MKIGNNIFFEKKKVALGTGHVIGYTLFENKRLFSILFYKWHTIDQIRYHSHCFSAIAFLIKGCYWEKIKYKGFEMTNFVNIPFLPRFIPMGYCHAIKKSKPGTLTMVLTGPWCEFWYEYFPKTDKEEGYWQKYAWGREKVSTHSELPDEI